MSGDVQGWDEPPPGGVTVEKNFPFSTLHRKVTPACESVQANVDVAVPFGSGGALVSTGAGGTDGGAAARLSAAPETPTTPRTQSNASSGFRLALLAVLRTNRVT